jgi:RND family efflux transporter MFP subunit
MRFLVASALGAGLTMLAFVPASAGSVVVAAKTVPEWKAVYGRVEARDTVPARARIGGTLVSLSVTEGDVVKAGQRMALVQDDKLALQVASVEAQMQALIAQRANVESDLARGQALVDRGAATVQRVDQLRTQVDVLRNQIASTEAQKQVLLQQASEGAVLAPADGRVLTVPVTRGAVIMAGEPVATLGGGGVFLRLAIPERHAALLKQGAEIRIETAAGSASGRLAKLYPTIDAGRVTADVEVADLPVAFLGARLLVRVPVGTRQSLSVPAAAVETRSGLDFVTVKTAAGPRARVVVTGGRDGDEVEILTGLVAGDEVVTP